jgi:SAM-dependent methyltransferase
VSESTIESKTRVRTGREPASTDPHTDGATTDPRGATPAADWVFARIPRGRRDVVLDVGAGAGLGGRSLSADVRQVIALGASEAILETGREQATAAGVENMLFMRGDAAALPFLDASFRVVLCRFALHHFDDPRVQLAEIKRVLRPRGWLGLADLVVSEDPPVAARQNAIEALRDGSHIQALSASQLQDRVVRLGYEVAGVETHELRRPLGAWLEPVGTPKDAAEEIGAWLEADLAGGEPTGLSPQRETDGGLSVLHTLTSLLILNRDA